MPPPNVNRLLSALRVFFFGRISASGFGLLRIGWAATTLAFLLPRLGHTTYLYSEAGLIPSDIQAIAFRSSFRFSLLDYVNAPPAVFALYLLLIGCLLCTMLGLWTRIMMIASVVLLFSFHEGNLFVLGGGDTVIRIVGFLLLICPELRAFSLDRARGQWQHWQQTRAFLPPLTMSAWPYRLALWQLLCIYISSAWDKLLGSMWLSGLAVSATLHHPHFARWPLWMADWLAPLSFLFCYLTLVFEFAWLLLLIPSPLLLRLSRGRLHYHALKRALLLAGVLFHGGILLLMEVGSFSVIMMVFYLGLLVSEDFAAMKAFWNKRWHGTVYVLYDGQCRLCRRSAFTLQMLDHLKRLEIVNFHDEAKRRAIVPELSFEELDRAMHVKLPDGTVATGFDALRRTCRYLPALWLLTPLLYLPGARFVGDRVYAAVAARRKQCGASCEL